MAHIVQRHGHNVAAVLRLKRLRVVQQDGEDKVLRGDRGAVVVGQALIDADGIGLGAVFVDNILMGFDNNRVKDELAVLSVEDGAVTKNQVADFIVCRAVGPAGHHVGIQVGYRTADNFIFGICTGWCGSTCVGRRVVPRIARRSTSLIAAGSKGKSHHCCKQ